MRSEAAMHYQGSIKRKAVKSRAVRSIGYDRGQRVLQVKFISGDLYNYFRVPPLEYDRLMHADSIGGHVNREIKPYYEYEHAELAEESGR
jgi:hypothetical protein